MYLKNIDTDSFKIYIFILRENLKNIDTDSFKIYIFIRSEKKKPEVHITLFLKYRNM